MPDLFSIQSSVMLVISLALFGLKAFAFVDAVTRQPALFTAVDKQSKPFWLIVLGLALVANMVLWSPFSILNLVGSVAALVYVADTRPALQASSGRR